MLLLYLPNCSQYLVAALGAFRAGVVLSPANPQYKARELSYQLDDAGVDAVVTHPALRGHLADGIAAASADPVVVTVDVGGYAEASDRADAGDGSGGSEGGRARPARARTSRSRPSEATR